MKRYNKSRISGLYLILLTLILGTTFLACEKDNNGGGVPTVTYVRVADPLKSDSLLTHAFMGKTIAIVGTNLQDVKEIWFNDQKAKLNMSFITEKAIIVTVPNEIPGVVTNEMKMIMADKKEYKFPFGVDVPAPLVNSLTCEYVKEGDIAEVNGNFFINDPNTPLQVIFPGNIPGTITESTITKIKVKVPAGAGVGPIQVKSLYGSSRSTFYFRDDRNIILNFDDLTAAGGWRAGVTGNSAPSSINGNYVRFRGPKTEDDWSEDSLSFNYWPKSQGRPDIPFAGNIATYCLKFECNIVEPWSSGALQMIFTSYSTQGTNGYISNVDYPRALWIPWKETGSYKTNGWITVTVPLSDFKYTPKGGSCATPLTPEMISGLTFFIYNGGVKGTDCHVHMCIDNIRIVPIQ